jgi:alcohol dehydrogenase class IV
LLPHVYLYNLSALGAKARQLGRIWRVPSPELVAAEVWDLMAEFGLPASLSALGLKRETLAAVAQESLSSASMAANPKSVDLQSLETLLEKAY